MKPYLVITGGLFGLITVLHIWRAIAEWSYPHSLGFGLGMVALIALPAILSLWAWRLLRNLSNGQMQPGSKKDES
jgi:hypothetical protein